MAKATKKEELKDEEKAPLFPPAGAEGVAEALEASLKDAAKPEAPESPKAAEKAPEPPKSPLSQEKWLVTEHKVINWKGAMGPMHKGTILSEQTHGKGCIEQLKAAGVKMEPYTAPVKK